MMSQSDPHAGPGPHGHGPNPDPQPGPHMGVGMRLLNELIVAGISVSFVNNNATITGTNGNTAAFLYSPRSLGSSLMALCASYNMAVAAGWLIAFPDLPAPIQLST